MVLTIKNFESQNIWPWVVETAPTNLVWVAGALKATLTWTSATGESWVNWESEILVRKEGSAPAWSLDWDVVVTITTKDVYASTWYEDTGLDSTKTYYYKVFAIYDNWTEKGSSEVNVTPEQLTSFNYAFLNKNLEEMKSDWWIFSTDEGRETHDGGLGRLDPSSNRYAQASIPFSCATANKITIRWYGRIIRWNSAGSGGVNVSSQVDKGWFYAWWWTSGTTAIAPNYWIRTSSNSVTQRTTIDTWMYEYFVEFDLVDKIGTMTFPGFPEKSISLSDADINWIKSCKYLQLDFDKGGNNVWEVSINIE